MYVAIAGRIIFEESFRNCGSSYTLYIAASAGQFPFDSAKEHPFFPHFDLFYYFSLLSSWLNLKLYNTYFFIVLNFTCHNLYCIPLCLFDKCKSWTFDIRIVINNVQEKISNKLLLAFDLILDAILYAMNVYNLLSINMFKLTDRNRIRIHAVWHMLLHSGISMNHDVILNMRCFIFYILCLSPNTCARAWI